MISDCLLKKGKKVAGLKQVLKGIYNNEIKTVYIATDCDGFIESKVLSAGKDLEIIKRYTGRQLGSVCNIDVEAAVVGIAEAAE